MYMGVCVYVLNKQAGLFLFTHSRSKRQRGLVREQTALVVATCSRPTSGEVHFAGLRVLCLDT